jgi:ferredoxin
MGCGLCADICTQDACSLARNERRGIPLDLDDLASL